MSTNLEQIKIEDRAPDWAPLERAMARLRGFQEPMQGDMATAAVPLNSQGIAVVGVVHLRLLITEQARETFHFSSPERLSRDATASHFLPLSLRKMPVLWSRPLHVGRMALPAERLREAIIRLAATAALALDQDIAGHGTLLHARREVYYA